jgi:hypothetical protein
VPDQPPAVVPSDRARATGGGTLAAGTGANFRAEEGEINPQRVVGFAPITPIQLDRSRIVQI